MDVNIDKILPVVEIKDKLDQIVREVAGGDDIYLATLDGKPSAIIVGIHHLETLTGMSHEDLMPDDDFEKAKDDLAAPPAETPGEAPAPMPSDSATVEDPFVTPYQASTPAATPVAPTGDIVSPPPADSATVDSTSPDLIVPPADDMTAPVDGASSDLMASAAEASTSQPADDIFTTPSSAQVTGGATPTSPTPTPMDQPVGPAPAQSTVDTDTANPPATPPANQM